MADMKGAIAEAAKECLRKNGGRKLTIKDIVNECGITRQTFYYHFSDITEMTQWIIERDVEKFLTESDCAADPERTIKGFFEAVIDGIPYVRRAFKAGYRDEICRIIEKEITILLERLIGSDSLYGGLEAAERRTVMRYHTYALVGILNDWTADDTENIDMIVHRVYLLIKGEAGA